MNWIRAGQVLAGWLALAGCTGLQPVTVERLNTYALDVQFDRRADPAPSGLTLLVGRVRESPGFDSARMAYMRKPHELEYFARNQWVDPAGKMLGPLLVRALEASGAFRAVALSPVPVAGDLRLDTELVRLLQDFQSSPSVVRLTMRAQLVDVVTRRVVATREFEASEAASSDDPYGGVVAANRAAHRVLDELAGFCAVQSGTRVP